MSRVFERHRLVDKRNYKKQNMFLSYVNAMFNGGVFANPYLDQC